MRTKLSLAFLLIFSMPLYAHAWFGQYFSHHEPRWSADSQWLHFKSSLYDAKAEECFVHLPSRSWFSAPETENNFVREPETKRLFIFGEMGLFTRSANEAQWKWLHHLPVRYLRYYPAAKAFSALALVSFAENPALFFYSIKTGDLQNPPSGIEADENDEIPIVNEDFRKVLGIAAAVEASTTTKTLFKDAKQKTAPDGKLIDLVPNCWIERKPTAVVLHSVDGKEATLSQRELSADRTPVSEVAVSPDQTMAAIILLDDAQSFEIKRQVGALRIYRLADAELIFDLPVIQQGSPYFGK